MLPVKLIRGYLIKNKARTTVVVKYASEFRYKVLIVTSKDVVIAISQPRVLNATLFID